MNPEIERLISDMRVIYLAYCLPVIKQRENGWIELVHEWVDEEKKQIFENLQTLLNEHIKLDEKSYRELTAEILPKGE